jgi:hypothetical protein
MPGVISDEPVVNLIVTTKTLGRSFREAGRPARGAPQRVTAEHLARFAAISAKYGHWYDRLLACL